MSAHSPKPHDTTATTVPRQNAPTDLSALIRRMEIGILKEAESPTVRRNEFMKAIHLASHTVQPEVLLAALRSSNKSIRIWAWGNPALSNLGVPAIEVLLETVPKDDLITIRRLAGIALNGTKLALNTALRQEPEAAPAQTSTSETIRPSGPS